MWTPDEWAWLTDDLAPTRDDLLSVGWRYDVQSGAWFQPATGALYYLDEGIR